MRASNQFRGADLLRRLFDVAVASVALALTSPILVLATLAIIACDRGPVFYRRRVVGLNGVPFHAYKLRTMIRDADEWLDARPALRIDYSLNMKLRDDPRVTPVGRLLRRLSLDELPQLVNVIRGQMSVVGPRMIHPDELDRFGDFAITRTTVKPGVTGLWQVSGRQWLDYSARVALDADYIERRSIGLDLWILWRTIVVVIRGDGAL